MTGLLLALASFLFLAVSGYPLACLLLRDGRRGLRLILSPLLGLCFDAIVLYLLGFHGNLPARTSAFVLLAVVLVLNAAFAVGDKTYFRFSGTEAKPLLAGLAYLLLLAAPFFIAGRSYMSIWNEDFYGYVAVADYLKDHTPNERLDPALVGSHPVYERVDLIIRVHFQDRFYRIGPEYYLSFASVVLGLDARELFFPVLISFAMLTPLGLFLFLAVFGIPRRTALAAAVLLPFFSFHYFGFIAQLFAQAAGVPVVLLCFWAMDRAFNPPRLPADRGLLCLGLVGAILLYIEAMVLLAPLAIYWIIRWLGRKRRFIDDAKTAAVVLLVLVVFFNVKFLSVVEYEVGQAHVGDFFKPSGGDAIHRPIQFPYFLVETGAPTVWGLVTAPVDAWPFKEAPPAVLWFVMLASGALFAIALTGIVAFPHEQRGLWASVGAFLAAAVALAFFARMDHLLYKLIMWSQFFFCASLVVGIRTILAARRKTSLSRMIVAVPLTCLIVFNAANILAIGRASLGESTVWVEWRRASRQNHLGRLEAARSSLDPSRPMAAIIPDFHPGRWASYLLKNFRISFLVNNTRKHFRSRYEGMDHDNGWNAPLLLLTDPSEDIFKNRLPAGSVVRDAGYFLIARAERVSNYLFPVSTARGIIRQANPEIAATVGWYPFEIYPKSPWAFDRRGFRWVENNSTFLVKNVTREPLFLKLCLEVAPAVEPVPMRLEFAGQTLFDGRMTAQSRLLSGPFSPDGDGLGRIVFDGPGARINAGRKLRLINRDIGSDDRRVNARIGRMEVVRESETKRLGFFFGDDHFNLFDLDKDNFYFSGLYPDGWAAPEVRFLLDLRERRSFLYRITVPRLASPDGFALSVLFDGTQAARLVVHAPGEITVEVPIPPEFRKVTAVDIVADRAWPISGRDPRRSVYVFRNGELVR